MRCDIMQEHTIVISCVHAPCVPLLCSSLRDGRGTGGGTRSTAVSWVSGPDVLLEHVTRFVQAIMLAVLFGGAMCGQATRLVVFSGMVL